MLLILAIRLPLFYFGVPVIIPELKWLLIGEALANGKGMYKDIWDFTGPLSAGFYSVLHMVFGKSIGAYRAISMLLVLIQCGIFNNLLLNNKAYNQNTYVPALMYMIFMHMSFDFLTLSPVLMGMTFALLAVNNLFQRMDNTTRDELFVQMGFYIGIATLFHLPFFLYFIVIILSLLIYTGSIFRRMLLMVYGYLIVLTLAALYYFWFDSLSIFRIFYAESAFVLNSFDYFSWKEYLGLSAIPLAIFIVAYFKTKAVGRYINAQIKIQNVMLLFMGMGIFSVILSKEFSIYQLIFIVPGLAFFTTHYLLLLKRWVVTESITLIICSLLILNMLFPLKEWVFVDELASYDNLIAQESPYKEITSGKEILVIGDHIELYRDASLATPYLNWQFSQKHLENLEYYDNLTETFINFSENLPEVIIDEKGVVEKLFDKMPTIALKYSQHDSFDHVFVLKASRQY
ncbi:MAG: hypothetical protein ACJA1A_003920 [Saprospiraceae bacterium]|jgi:hypothetical protein